MRDLGSSNGTFVNGQRVDRLKSEGIELFSGDYIQFGEDVDDNFCVRATVRLLPDEIQERESGNQMEMPLIPTSGMHFVIGIMRFLFISERVALPLIYMSHFVTLLEGQMEIRSFEPPNSKIHWPNEELSLSMY